MAERHCEIPRLAAGIPATALNVVMVIHIFKYKNPNHGVGSLFQLIGICNILFGIFMSFKALVDHSQQPKAIHWFVTTGTMTSFCLHLGFNIALAFKRQQLISKPLHYHTSEFGKALERKLCLVVIIVSFTIGLSSTIAAFTSNTMLVLFISIAVTRILGYVTLCILYVLVFRKIKERKVVTDTSSANTAQPSTSNSDVVSRQKRKLAHTKKFLIGITTSYLLFNLPTMITFLAIDDIKPCDSIKGIAASVSTVLTFFNCIFDVIWYFYMERRSRDL